MKHQKRLFKEDRHFHNSFTDYSKDFTDYYIVNKPEDGEVAYSLGIWTGSGYYVARFLCFADNFYEAIDRTFDYCNEKYKDQFVFNRSEVEEAASRYLDMYDEYEKLEDMEKELEELKDKYSDHVNNLDNWTEYRQAERRMDELEYEIEPLREKLIDKYIDENYISNEEYTLYAYSENFRIDETPKEIADEILSQNADNLEESKGVRSKKVMKENNTKKVFKVRCSNPTYSSKDCLLTLTKIYTIDESMEEGNKNYLEVNKNSTIEYEDVTIYCNNRKYAKEFLDYIKKNKDVTLITSNTFSFLRKKYGIFEVVDACIMDNERKLLWFNNAHCHGTYDEHIVDNTRTGNPPEEDYMSNKNKPLDTSKVEKGMKVEESKRKLPNKRLIERNEKKAQKMRELDSLVCESSNGIFKNEEIKRCADIIMKKFGDIDDFEDFYNNVSDWMSSFGDISEKALADEYFYEVDELENDDETYRQAIDTFIEDVYDRIQEKKELRESRIRNRKVIKENIDIDKEQVIKITDEMKEKYPSLKKYDEIVISGKKMDYDNAKIFAKENASQLPSIKELEDIWRSIGFMSTDDELRQSDNWKRKHPYGTNKGVHFAWTNKTETNDLGTVYYNVNSYGNYDYVSKDYIAYVFCLR